MQSILAICTLAGGLAAAIAFWQLTSHEDTSGWEITINGFQQILDE
jgi:hypothetical protein